MKRRASSSSESESESEEEEESFSFFFLFACFFPAAAIFDVFADAASESPVDLVNESPVTSPPSPVTPLAEEKRRTCVAREQDAPCRPGIPVSSLLMLLLLFP